MRDLVINRQVFIFLTSQSFLQMKGNTHTICVLLENLYSFKLGFWNRRKYTSPVF